MKNFLCAIALMLVASVGYSKTNEEKPVQKAKIVVKTQIEAKSSVPLRLRAWKVTCSNNATTVFACDCNQGQADAMGAAWCANQ